MPREYDPSKPLYFCHVPRTGGAALASFMLDMIGRDRLVNSWTASPGPGQMVQWHSDSSIGIGVHDVYPKADQFFTVLREPFDRMVSWYFYLKNFWYGEVKFCNRRWIRLSDHGGTLEGFLDGYSGGQGRFMPLGVPGVEPLPKMLDDFVFVGTTRRLFSAMRFLARTFGEPMSPLRRGNPCGEKDEPVTEGMRARFRERHAEDYALYDHAVKTWGRVWDEYER